MITPFGDTALLVDVEDDRAAHRLAARIESDPSAPPGIGEVVVGLRTVLVHIDPMAHPLGADPLGVEAWLAQLCSSVAVAPPAVAVGPPAAGVGPPAAGVGPPAAGDASRRSVEIPVTFDGPDLDDVAKAIGTTPEGVTELLTGFELRVAFLGFAPGFPYLVGLPEPLARIERRASPRTQVPAGSVALAGGFAAIYPQRTPGGWQLLGHTDVSMFTPDTPPFALLRAGDTVRFTGARPSAVSAASAPAPATASAASAAPASTSSAAPASVRLRRLCRLRLLRRRSPPPYNPPLQSRGHPATTVATSCIDRSLHRGPRTGHPHPHGRCGPARARRHRRACGRPCRSGWIPTGQSAGRQRRWRCSTGNDRARADRPLLVRWVRRRGGRRRSEAR